MSDIKPDDLISKTDILLFDILEELKQLNKSLRPIAKGTGVKRKAKPKTKTPTKKGGFKLDNSTNEGIIQDPEIYNPPL
jgi:hypothetical protein